jgi:hypothetical protein
MLKKILISFLTVFFFLIAGGSRGEAFVPQTPHLLYLMVGKIKEPAGLTVHQVRRILDPASDTVLKNLPESGKHTGPDPSASLEETLTYLFPGKLRAQVHGTAAPQFYVVSDGAAVRVDGGQVISMALSPFDSYTDILLYRDYEQLDLRLQAAGVNTQSVTFQRLDGRICYFIGQPPMDKKQSPGLWIDKDSFFPVRYLLQKGPWQVDVWYDDWQRVSRTWYPMAIRILVNDRVFAEISADSIALAAGFASDLFDVDLILAKFPKADDADPSENGHKDRIKALDKELEEFNKLYD